MKEGDPFNVSKVWPEVRIPLEMIKDRSVSFCTKMAYGLLVMYAGSAGYCSLDQEEIARDLGVSKELVRKSIKILKQKKYIMTMRQGYGRPARYYFLWRKEFILKTGGPSRIDIDPQLHTNIMEYYKKMVAGKKGKGGQEKGKEGCGEA